MGRRKVSPSATSCNSKDCMPHGSDTLQGRRGFRLTDGLLKNPGPGLTMRWTSLTIAVLVAGMLVLEVGVCFCNDASLSRVP